MTKSFKAVRRLGSMNIELIVKIIENRIYMKVKGIPSPHDQIVLQQLMKVKKKALEKGVGKEEVLSNVGGWIILENKQNTKSEEEIAKEQKEGFIKQNFKIIEEK